MELKPGYKQTEVGVIPEDWEVQPLLKAVHIANGQVSPKQEPYKSMTLVAPDHIESSTGRLLSKKTAADQGAISGKYIFDSGDIIYSKIRPYLRKAILADFSGLCSADMYPLKPAPWVAGGYILAVILGNRFTRYAESVSVRSGMPKINRSEMADFAIAVPPLPEQHAIASALADIDRLTRDLEVLIAKKRNIKQAAMQELLTGKRRLPGLEGEWAQVSLGSVAMMNSGGTPPTGRDDFYGGGIPWVSISDMTSSGRFISETERTLSDLGLANCAAKQFPAGTILYAMYASLGECSIAAREVTTSQAILGIRPGSSLVGEYLYYWLESIRGAVKLMGQQGTQSNLNKKIVQEFSLSLPSKTEQAAIALALSEIDQEIDALKVKAEKTRAIKDGMMQQLLTGKIRLT